MTFHESKLMVVMVQIDKHGGEWGGIERRYIGEIEEERDESQQTRREGRRLVIAIGGERLVGGKDMRVV